METRSLLNGRDCDLLLVPALVTLDVLHAAYDKLVGLTDIVSRFRESEDISEITEYFATTYQLRYIFDYIKAISGDPAIRAECGVMGAKFAKYFRGELSRKEFYYAMLPFVGTSEFATSLMRKISREGTNLNVNLRAELAELQARCDVLCETFMDNTKQDPGLLLTSLESCDGMPTAWIDDIRAQTMRTRKNQPGGSADSDDGGLGHSMHRGPLNDSAEGDGHADTLNSVLTELGGTFLMVPQTSVNIVSMLTNAKVESTRKCVYEMSSGRCTENIPILTELVNVRSRIARLLGYETYLDYATESRRGPHPDKVMIQLEHAAREQFASCADIAPHNQYFVVEQRQPSQGTYTLDDILHTVWEVLKVKLVPRGGIHGLVYDAYAGGGFSMQRGSPDDVGLGPRTLDDGDGGGCVHCVVYFDIYARVGKPAQRMTYVGSYEPLVAAIVLDLPEIVNSAQMKMVMHEIGHLLHLMAVPYTPMCGAFDIGRDIIELPAMWAEAEYAAWLARAGTTRSQAQPLAKNGFEVARQFVLAKFDIVIHSLRFAPPDEKPDLLTIWMNIEASLGIGGSTPCAALWMFPHLAGEYAGYYYGYAFSESAVPKIEWNDPIVAMRAVLASI